ncbi:adenosylcobinamide-phosphate synthase [Pseudanabaena sp. lw0831]|uniref:adenosylcobinamide-phosphate synthase CbiB n=1 Tax=Pseudanabaena sp. lw0831 TaxID=1357935 RepID=UPI001A29B5EB|nr:adenosylcobinamide-phosphate synthase CbiB [Pseudanabaena sp. lw0831]GBO56541.1 adenosylcobinamide-phosphate synthase [Pseudanabaena sp. lw0831]
MLELSPNFLILIFAAGLDRLIGDPVNWLHPVQVMGWMISQFTNLVLIKDPVSSPRIPRFSPLIMKMLGLILGTSMILGSGIGAWLIAIASAKVHPIFAIAVSSILLAACFAGRSLRNAAESVLTVLQTGNIENARQELSRYVGRDTENLTELEILRAVLETVTENAIDAVTSPLFYALIGSLLFDYGGVALAIAYKAASTLDSMVGYRESPYTDLGWFSAKTDDVLTWLPCRLTVITLALMSGKPIYVWQICDRDAKQDPSPNSGWSECVYAAILQVQVGGENRYRGLIKQKPLLGDAIEAIAAPKISQALKLTRICFLIWLSLVIVIANK